MANETGDAERASRLQQVKLRLLQDQSFLDLPSKELKMRRIAEEMGDAIPGSSTEGPIRQFVRPVLEGGGAIVGTAFSIPATPVVGPFAPAIGGALGFAGGSALSTTLEVAFGEQPGPQEVEDAIGLTLDDLETGFTAEAFGRGAGKFLELGGGVIRRIAEGSREPLARAGKNIQKIAEKFGIELTPAEVTGEKSLSLLEALLEKLPFSADEIQRLRLANLNKLLNQREKVIGEGAEKDVEQIGIKIQTEVEKVLTDMGVADEGAKRILKDRLLQKLGSPNTFSELGTQAQQAATKATEADNAAIKEAYAAIGESIPQGARIRTDNFKGVANEIKEESGDLFSLLKSSLRAITQKAQSTGNPKLDALIDQSRQGRRQRAAGFLPQEGSPPPTMAELEMSAAAGREWSNFEFLRRSINQAISDQSPIVGLKGAGKTTDNQTTRLLMRLKNALDQDLEAFGNSTGGAINQAVSLARGLAGQLKAKVNKDEIIAFFQAAPESAIGMVVRKNAVTPIKNLKAVLGNDFEIVRQATTKRIIGESTSMESIAANMRSQMKIMSKETLDEIFPSASVEGLEELASSLEKNVLPVKNEMFKSMLRKSPEKVVQFIVQPNNTVNIDAVEQLLGEPGLELLQAGTMQKILAVNRVDMLSPRQVVTQMFKLGPNTLQRLFKNQPNLLKDLKEIRDVSSRMEKAESIAGNPSGTAQNVMSGFMVGLMLFEPVKGISLGAGIHILGKFYASPKGRELLVEGLMTRPGGTKARQWTVKAYQYASQVLKNAPEAVTVLTRPLFSNPPQSTNPLIAQPVTSTSLQRNDEPRLVQAP